MVIPEDPYKYETAEEDKAPAYQYSYNPGYSFEDEEEEEKPAYQYSYNPGYKFEEEEENAPTYQYSYNPGYKFEEEDDKPTYQYSYNPGYKFEEEEKEAPAYQYSYNPGYKFEEEEETEPTQNREAFLQKDNGQREGGSGQQKQATIESYHMENYYHMSHQETNMMKRRSLASNKLSISDMQMREQFKMKKQTITYIAIIALTIVFAGGYVAYKCSKRAQLDQKQFIEEEIKRRTGQMPEAVR